MTRVPKAQADDLEEGLGHEDAPGGMRPCAHVTLGGSSLDAVLVAGEKGP